MSNSEDLGHIANWFRAKANMYATCASAASNFQEWADEESSKLLIQALRNMSDQHTKDPWPI